MNVLIRLAALAALSTSLPLGAVAQAQPAPDAAPPPSNATNPDTAKSQTVPDAAKPDAAKPDASVPDHATPEAAVPDAPKPNAAVVEPAPAPTPPPAPQPASDVGLPGPAIPGSPDLSVATVKMEGGLRSSKIVGAAVSNGSNQQVGTVDDLILNHDGRAVLGVISVGGFLGVGGKLVAVPYTALHVDASGKVTLPDASKESLNRMPGFTYAQ